MSAYRYTHMCISLGRCLLQPEETAGAGLGLSVRTTHLRCSERLYHLESSRGAHSLIRPMLAER